MIIQLQKKFKGKLFQILLWFVAALFLLPVSITQIVSYFTSGSPWMISVNGDGISKTQVQTMTHQFEERIKQLEQQYPQFASMYLQLMGLDQDPKQLAIDSLVRQSLLYQASQTLGLPVSHAQIEKQFSGVDPRLLRAQLRQAGMTVSEFEEQVAKDIAIGMVESLVKQTTYVPEYIMKDYYRTNFLGKKFSLVPFKFSDFLAQETAKQMPQETLKAFYDEQNSRSKRYQTPEKRSGYVWKFDPALFGITVSQDEVERYYQANKSHYKDKPAQVQVRRILFPQEGESSEEAVKKAKEVRSSITNTAQFESVAKSLAGQDKEYGSRSGLMPFFSAGTHEREFEKAAFTLQNDGDISEPIATKDGVVLIQRIEKKQPTFKSLQSVSNDIKNILTQQKFNSQFIGQARKALDQTKTNPSALESFATLKGGKKQPLTQVVSDQDPIAKALFKLQPQGVTAFQEGDLGIIVQLTSIEKSAIPSFESMAQAISKDYAQAQAKNALQQALKKAKEEAVGRTDKEFKDLFGARVEQTQLIKPSDEKAVARLKERGISMIELFQLEKVGDVTLSYSGQDGFIVRLEALEQLNEQDFQNRKAEFKANVVREEEQNVFMGFVASLYRNATIKQK